MIEIIKSFIIAWACVFVLLGATANAQSSNCQIGKTKFACPDSSYFKPVKSGDSSTRIFRHSEIDDLYFFVSVPSGEFDPVQIGKSITASFSTTDPAGFKWKPVVDPIVMSTSTKQEFKLVAAMGLGGATLVEVKGFLFKIKGKQIVLGYLYNWGDGRIESIRRQFERGKGVGDSAPGCNAVVTVLNSITHEFKEKKQYCFLTGLGSRK